MRDVLLALSVGAMFLYGFYIMKKVDEFIEEIQKSRRGHDLSEDDVDEHKSDMYCGADSRNTCRIRIQSLSTCRCGHYHAVYYCCACDIHFYIKDVFLPDIIISRSNAFQLLLHLS